MKTLRPVLSIILFRFFVYAMLSVRPSHTLQFNYPSFNYTDLSDIIRFVYQDPAWYSGQNAMSNNSAIWLTPNPIEVHTNKYTNIGKFVYKDLVQFKNPQSDSPNQVVSFNTSFTFQIINNGSYDESGSGMAFFISTFDKAPNHSDGRYFGLVDPDAAAPEAEARKFFAVEFDTRISPNLNDSSASHIGIDINSVVSRNATDTSPNSKSPFYPQLYLYNNYTFTAWIEYSSLTNLTQVWMTNSTYSKRPSQACLQLSSDLSDVFEDVMYIGFSATNKAGENGMEGHVVFSWSFTSEDFSKPEHSKVIVPIAITLSVLFVLGAFGITLYLIIKKRRTDHLQPLTIRSSHSKSSMIVLGSGHCTLPRYSYKELKRSAHGFREQSKIGEGGFSSVYRATFADGSIVAIKRLKEGLRKEAEFSAEMTIISSIRHRNLLQLQGWCYEKGEAMLVYKYMSNGSLERYLYGKRKGELQSETRLKILVGVASALEYLHGDLGECVLHRDVKAANVLLTEGFEPMLGDFGLARLIGHDEGAVTMTAVGTPGYVAPEVVYTGRFTDKADVYSFGVLALEMAYGRPAMDRSSLEVEEGRIADYAWMLHERGQLMEALDPYMIMEDNRQKEQWRLVLHLALMCCNPSPEARPTMRQVYQALKEDNALFTHPLPARRPDLYPTNPNWPSYTSGSSASWTESSVTNSRSVNCGPSSTASCK